MPGLGYVPAPERRAGGRGRWRRRDRHHCSPDPAPPRGRAAAAPPQPPGGSPACCCSQPTRMGLRCARYAVLRGEKQRAKVRVASSNTASSRAQTVSAGCGEALLVSRLALFLGKAVGKPSSLRCQHEVMYGFAMFISEGAVVS